MKNEFQCSTVAEHVPCFMGIVVYDTQSTLLFLQQILCKELHA
jgi:hypothetical protein